MAKKDGIRKLFDNIAPDYDRLNHLLSLNIDKGWRKKAVRELVDTTLPLNVLDVACGTGDFTIEIAQKVGAQHTWITHLSHQLPCHQELAAELPKNISPAFDGLKLEC